MSLEEKLDFFKMLVDIGFKEIEVGFPAASDTEYNFMRALIERNMIPEDVTVQVLTQAREHIIKKTFDAVKGAPHAIIHLYNSTSVAQREQVFKKSKEEVKKLAVDGALMMVCGVLTIIETIVVKGFASTVIMLVLIIAMSALMIYYSYVFYKKYGNNAKKHQQN